MHDFQSKLNKKFDWDLEFFSKKLWNKLNHEIKQTYILCQKFVCPVRIKQEILQNITNF